MTANSLCNVFMQKTFKRSIHKQQNHYEVLKLAQNCTHTDIKRAYYELSKKYHPDRNHNSSPKLFLDVSEAYKTLSKPDSRLRYDISLLPAHQRFRANHYDLFARRNLMDEPAFYRPRRTNYEYDIPLHQFKTRQGERISNAVVICIVLLTMIIGVAIQVMAVRHALRVRREELKISQALANRRMEKGLNTEDPTNKTQVKLLEERCRANNISLD